MSDRDDLVSSVHQVVRDELKPLGRQIEKLEGAINGREGLIAEVAGMQKLCHYRHGSGPPPPRPPQESVADLLDREHRKHRRIPWGTIGIVLAALITAGATVWGASAAAAAQVRTMQQAR